MTEEQKKWYERETAAFRAWWEAGGEKTYSETPTMAAGAGWLKRAEAASSETLPTREQAAAAIGEIIATDPGQRSAIADNCPRCNYPGEAPRTYREMYGSDI